MKQTIVALAILLASVRAMAQEGNGYRDSAFSAQNDSAFRIAIRIDYLSKFIRQDSITLIFMRAHELKDLLQLRSAPRVVKLPDSLDYLVRECKNMFASSSQDTNYARSMAFWNRWGRTQWQFLMNNQDFEGTSHADRRLITIADVQKDKKTNESIRRAAIYEWNQLAESVRSR
jgi:hypothetical protein